MMKKLIVCLVGLVVSLQIFAHTVNTEKKQKETPKKLFISLGYISTSGNSDTSSGNFETLYKFTRGKLKMNMKMSFLFSDVEDSDTGDDTRQTERYEAVIKSNYLIKTKAGVFGNINWRRDVPSGIKNYQSLAAGVNLTPLDNDSHKLNAGVGIEAFRETKIEEIDESSDSNFAGYFEVTYDFEFNSENSLHFENETMFNLSESEDYRLSSNISFVSNINKTLALKLIFKHDYKNLPVEGKEKTDTTSTINLVFRF